MPPGRKPYNESDPDPGDVSVLVDIDAEHEWRMRMLEGECGLEHFAAFRLSVSGADWHEVQRLLAAGATPEQVLEILLP